MANRYVLTDARLAKQTSPPSLERRQDAPIKPKEEHPSVDLQPGRHRQRQEDTVGKKKKKKKEKRADDERGSRATVGSARQSRLSTLILGFVARRKKKEGSTRAGLRFISYVRGTI